jgi:hypothetical protein
MPYKLRKAPNRNLYWVVTIETKKKHSKDPIPLEKAKAQMRILESALLGGITPIELRRQKEEAARKKQKMYENATKRMMKLLEENKKPQQPSKLQGITSLEAAKKLIEGEGRKRLVGGGKWKNLAYRLIEIGLIPDSIFTNKEAEINAKIDALTREGWKGEFGFKAKKQVLLDEIRLPSEAGNKTRDLIDRFKALKTEEELWKFSDRLTSFVMGSGKSRKRLVGGGEFKTELWNRLTPYGELIREQIFEIYAPQLDERKSGTNYLKLRFSTNQALRAEKIALIENAMEDAEELQNQQQNPEQIVPQETPEQLDARLDQEERELLASNLPVTNIRRGQQDPLTWEEFKDGDLVSVILQTWRETNGNNKTEMFPFLYRSLKRNEAFQRNNNRPLTNVVNMREYTDRKVKHGIARIVDKLKGEGKCKICGKRLSV